MNYRLYFYQVGLLFGATAIAQAINFAAYPLLSRTYDSTDFGLFSIFVSGVSVLGPLAAGRFDVVVQAAPYPRRHAALSLATAISVPVAIASGIAYAFVGPEVGMPHALAGALFGLAIFLTAYTVSSTAFLVKHEAYRANGRAIVTRSAMTAGPQIALFFVLPDQRGLTLGFCLGLLAQALLLHLTARKLGLRPSRGLRLKALVSRYRQYPLYDVPSTFLSTFTLYAANFFLFDLYGPNETGYFAFAFRLAGLPMALLASSMSEVFFQKAAKSFHAHGTFWKPFRVNLLVAGGLAFVIMVATILLARVAVGFYLGRHWDMVATVLIILAPMMAGRFLFVAVASAPLVTGRTSFLLASNATLAAATLLVYLVARATKLGFTEYLTVASLVIATLYATIVTAISVQTYRRYRRP